MPQASKHRCPAPECQIVLPARQLMCAAHWRLVPDEIKAKVYKTYRLRKRGGRYEAEYFNATKEAIDAVRRWHHSKALFMTSQLAHALNLPGVRED